jgi:hypothetical protein
LLALRPGSYRNYRYPVMAAWRPRRKPTAVEVRGYRVVTQAERYDPTRLTNVPRAGFTR